ncbi:hypothetical protein ACWGKW_42475 [Streptomyces sp. NPDC054766]
MSDEGSRLFGGKGGDPQLPARPAIEDGADFTSRLQQAEVFDQLHRILLTELNAAGQLDWSRACVDSSHARTKKRGVPTPVRRRSTGARRAADTT